MDLETSYESRLCARQLRGPATNASLPRRSAQREGGF